MFRDGGNYRTSIDCLTSDIKFVSISPHFTAVKAVVAATVCSLCVVYLQAVFTDGKPAANTVAALDTSVDIHITEASSDSRVLTPFHSTGLCRVTPHQHRVTSQLRNTLVLTSCCVCKYDTRHQCRPTETITSVNE